MNRAEHVTMRLVQRVGFRREEVWILFFKACCGPCLEIVAFFGYLGLCRQCSVSVCVHMFKKDRKSVV